MPRPLALATYASLPHLSAHEQALLPLFAQQGWDAQPVVWSDASVDWQAFELVIIRSCWDYHLRYEAFMAWLAKLEQLEVPTVNALALLRYNAQKTYLRDLSFRGIPTVPTHYYPGTYLNQLPELLEARQWERAVVKPVVSATAHHTFLVDASLDSRQVHAMEQALGDEVFMLQPFLPAIRGGEWSLVYFNQAFSHAAFKQAREGDFRVQEEYGGRTQLASPPATVIAQADAIMQRLTDLGPKLYTRLDGLVMDGTFVLMELELIEPELFLQTPALRQRFVEAFLAYQQLQAGAS